MCGWGIGWRLTSIEDSSARVDGDGLEFRLANVPCQDAADDLSRQYAKAHDTRHISALHLIASGIQCVDHLWPDDGESVVITCAQAQ